MSKQKQPKFPAFNKDKAEEGEKQIKEHSRIIDYRIREYPIEILVQKYLEGIGEGDNEIFIPDYQRHYVWPDKNASRFMESVLVGLPIPYLFVADVSNEDEDLDGRVEVVDGSQRLRALAKFLEDELELTDLKKLSELNGCKFSDLLPSRQRRFKRETIRLIELTEKADLEARRDMFDRLNSGGVKLTDMETRRGLFDGDYLKLIENLASGKLFRQLAPLGEAAVSRRDYDELVLRFFAYLDTYEDFGHKVNEFVDEYLFSMMSFSADNDKGETETIWQNMLNFVNDYFLHGFKKSLNNNRVKRVRFEAISVGVALAQKECPDLKGDKDKITEWAYGGDFDLLVKADGANSRPKVIARINYVRDKLLGV